MVRYRPSNSLSWLAEGAEAGLKKAERLTKDAVSRKSSESPKERIVSAGKALFEFAKSAYTEVSRSRAEAKEYALSDSDIHIISGSHDETVKFNDVKRIEVSGLNAWIRHKNGAFNIQPYAYVVAQGAKAPIGWNRDGHEVPFELLIQEIAARAGVEIE